MEDDMPLPALFEKARNIHAAASESSVDQETVKIGCQLLNKCEEMVSKLGLFSSNETKEDISTANLKYILVPFYLAELTEKIQQADRIQVVQESQAKLKEFLSFCDVMELVPKDELEIAEQAKSLPPADQRARKIARYKRKKAAESKLLEIKERKERRGRSSKASALSTPVEAGEEDELDEYGEEEREAWLSTISLAVCQDSCLTILQLAFKKLIYMRYVLISCETTKQALDLLEMLKKEEDMLSAVKQRQSKVGEEEFSQAVLDERAEKAEAWHRNAAVRAQYTKPAQPITCATFAQDVLEGRAQVSQAHDHTHQPLIFGPASVIGGRITTERERMAAQIFQPSHRMPTMSIEEAGLKEMEIMNTWQERNKKMMEEANSSWYNDKPLRPEPQEEDDDDDAAQEKARAWDDWKDDNPRGAGNKKLTPCG